MDRRSTLSVLAGKNASKSNWMEAPLPPESGLNTYDGKYEFEEAAHLLRRAMIGPTWEQISESVELGLAKSVELLLEEAPLPSPPLNVYYEGDPNVSIGETWIGQPYTSDPASFTYRFQSMRAWIVLTALREGISIREKMVLFWNNHFGVGNIADAVFDYNLNTLLRTYATGNFKELVQKITIDPSMLRFLNGNQNTNRAPNENYARELLELYTIGKGALAGPGDYSTFTESDVEAIAKILTGWRDIGFRRINPDVTPTSIFRPQFHDTSDKQLSHRFNHAVITNQGESEYLKLIDIIFEQNEVARFICRKLYRWFVYYVIDESVEMNIIEPLSSLLIENNFEIKPVLKALLSSAHFFDTLSIGPMIKNPFDYTIGMLKQFKVAIPGRLNQQYNIGQRIYRSMGQMELDYFNPPNVAGWKAYYQEPGYYRTWINASTLKDRTDVANLYALRGERVGGEFYKINALELIKTFENADDPNELIKDLAKLILPQPLLDQQYAALKEILIPGLPDYEWTVEYGLYLSDPENSDLRASIETKLSLLIQNLLSLPEYQLS